VKILRKERTIQGQSTARRRGVGFSSLLLSVIVSAIPASRSMGQDHVADTVHNLASSGPGSLRAQTETEVCVFCHAPHRTGGVTPLWNRELSPSSYLIYQSSTLDARPGQPTGTSKLCLSCHDGTLALGAVISRDEQIRMAGGDFIPAGLTNLGTDLSDDHPISFDYSPGLASAMDRQLVPPHTLPRTIKLDPEGQLQCTTCHDPHHNRFGDFLVMDDAFGALCTSCHVMHGWTASSHKDADVTVHGTANEDWPHDSVAANACRSCHRSHSAGGHERLLLHEAEEDNCLNCHDGSVARTDVQSVLEKPSAHDPRRYQGLHDPIESSIGVQAHVECTDCHNPHAVRSATARTGYSALGVTMEHVPGISAGGSPVNPAHNEFEVCFRCHGDGGVAVATTVSRQAQLSNLRLKFSATNPSYHPVVTTVANTDTISLVPELPNGSLILCTDCHNNDSGPRAGGVGPDGPHGSIYQPLLERNYTVRDDTVESASTYALCYKCHRRASILSNESFPYHRLHIVQERTPCSACHDAHGISGTQAFGSDHTHLINFDTRIVQPEGLTRRIEFRDMGRYAGSCTLSCHGAEHRDLMYGAVNTAIPNGGTIRRGFRR
jgi:predicted CXXCH cytochrome family protein